MWENGNSLGYSAVHIKEVLIIVKALGSQLIKARLGIWYLVVGLLLFASNMFFRFPVFLFNLKVQQLSIWPHAQTVVRLTCTLHLPRAK